MEAATFMTLVPKTDNFSWFSLAEGPATLTAPTMRPE
jgi:hypothetical protein